MGNVLICIVAIAIGYFLDLGIGWYAYFGFTILYCLIRQIEKSFKVPIDTK